LHLRTLVVDPQLVVECLTTPPASQTFVVHGVPVSVPAPIFIATRCERGLPEGARIVWTKFVRNRQGSDELHFVIEHPSFPPVGYWEDPPILPASEITFRRGDPRSCGFGHPCAVCKEA
jgi:hypothetical protein